jgi:hypothetical protein
MRPNLRPGNVISHKKHKKNTKLGGASVSCAGLAISFVGRFSGRPRSSHDTIDIVLRLRLRTGNEAIRRRSSRKAISH